MCSLIDYGLKSCIFVEVYDLFVTGRNIENRYIYFWARPIQTTAEYFPSFYTAL